MTTSGYEIAIVPVDVDKLSKNIVKFNSVCGISSRANILHGRLECTTREFFLAHTGFDLCDICADDNAKDRATQAATETEKILCAECLYKCGAHSNQLQDVALIVKIDYKVDDVRTQRKLWLEASLQQQLYERHRFNVAAPIGNYKTHRYYVRPANGVSASWQAAKISIFAQRFTLQRSDEMIYRNSQEDLSVYYSKRSSQSDRATSGGGGGGGSYSSTSYFGTDFETITQRIGASIRQVAFAFANERTPQNEFAIDWLDIDWRKDHNYVVCAHAELVAQQADECADSKDDDDTLNDTDSNDDDKDCNGVRQQLNDHTRLEYVFIDFGNNIVAGV